VPSRLLLLGPHQRGPNQPAQAREGGVQAARVLTSTALPARSGLDPAEHAGTINRPAKATHHGHGHGHDHDHGHGHGHELGEAADPTTTTTTKTRIRHSSFCE